VVGVRAVVDALILARGSRCSNLALLGASLGQGLDLLAI
jgi:hypothetical protein